MFAHPVSLSSAGPAQPNVDLGLAHFIRMSPQLPSSSGMTGLHAWRVCNAFGIQAGKHVAICLKIGGEISSPNFLRGWR